MFLKIIYGLLLLDIIVFVHELGHFFAARISGVNVECFSIGMGPIIFHKKINNIDWRLSLFPIGGYCGMKGENDFQTAYDNNLPSIQGEKDSLYGVHPIKRAFIGAAGPVANLIFAVIASTVISLTGYTYYSADPQIKLADEVYPEIHSPARDAGLITGDVISSINGEKVSDFAELYESIASKPDEKVFVTVMRNGEKKNFTIHTDMDKSTGAGKIGVVSVQETCKQREAKRYSFFPAVINGICETGKNIALTFKGIATLFKGVKITEAISGPAKITTMLGETVQEGFSSGLRNGIVSVLDFMALISISLFLMNMLPIPILDGGLIIFSLIEAVFRIHIPPRIIHYVQYIGLAFIILLFFIAAAGDIHYFTGLVNVKK